MKYRVIPEIIDIEVADEEFSIPAIYHDSDFINGNTNTGENKTHLMRHIVKANQPFIVKDNKPVTAISKDFLEENFEKYDTIKDRLIIEYKELGDKLGKLDNTLNSEGFIEKVGKTQYDLMCKQDRAMTDYWNTLKDRLDDLKIEVE